MYSGPTGCLLWHRIDVAKWHATGGVGASQISVFFNWLLTLVLGRYTNDDRKFFYDLPPWVSMSRSWDDLDRFLREYNDYLLGPARTNKNKSYVIQKVLQKIVTADGVEYRV